MELRIRIRELRNERGFTLKQLSALVGISAPHLSEVERGKKNLNNHLMSRLAGALDVSPQNLISDLQKTDFDDLLHVCRKLSPDDRARVQQFAEALALSSEKGTPPVEKCAPAEGNPVSDGSH